ncbi:MAG: hypothetical protein HQM12_09745 [SAR324 cluster bacterium]|nr:hypothetical protein [SAR324 cluster bacterium]
MQNTEQELQTKLEKLESQVQQIEREGRTRKWFHWPSTIIGVLLATVMLAVLGYASTPSSVSRTDFTSGTVISASTMNSQFNSIYTVMNDLLSLIQVKSGKVGINNAAPAYTLDVTGNAHVSGTFGATYFSVAQNRGVIVQTNSTNPTYQITITADALTLVNSNGIGYVAASVSTNADITSSGAGGLDTGSEAANTWYYIWVISNGTTTTGLLSTSAASPTMPSGYSFKRLVGAVANSGTDFIPFYQAGNYVQITATNSPTISSGFTSQSYTVLNLSSGMFSPPALTKAVHTLIYSSRTAEAFTIYIGNSTIDNQNIYFYTQQDTSAFTAGSFPVWIEHDQSVQTLNWRNVNINSTSHIYLKGYRYDLF